LALFDEVYKLKKALKNNDLRLDNIGRRDFMDFYTNNSDENFYINTKDIRYCNQNEDVDIQIEKTKEKTKYTKSKYLIFMISLILLIKILLDTSLTANATSYTPQRTDFSDSIGITITALGFDDHKGMMTTLKNNYIYCIQRGYPFRRKVSELQMVESTINNGVVSGTGTIASNIRLLLRQRTIDKNGSVQIKVFRCWGQATYNGDHTNAYQSGTNGAPTSSAWTEDFTEFRENSYI
jgi:hypothetical protein